MSAPPAREASVTDFWEWMVVNNRHIAMAGPAISARWDAAKRVHERMQRPPFAALAGADQLDGNTLQEIARAQANTFTFASAINQKDGEELHGAMCRLAETPESLAALIDGLDTARRAFAGAVDFLDEAIRRVEAVTGQRAS